ncbi:MAG: hypothetical protein K1X94_11965 [Sandaracinaceae bacterium]|nr:hypothetical protein [Sandaracinaceae bacterium]
MATKRRSPEREPTDRIVKRAPQDRKRLSPELEAFAAGDDDAIWRREIKSGRVHDPRVVALIPGLKNADARRVYEAHVQRIRKAMAEETQERLSEELAVVYACAIFRGYSIVSFEAFAEAVLGMPADRAIAMAKAGRVALGLPEALTEAEIAVWLRAEAGVLEVTQNGRVEVRDGVMTLSVPITRAAEALAAVGFREAPIARTAEGPRTVVDRPKGVPPMSAIVEREQRARRGEE